VHADVSGRDRCTNSGYATEVFFTTGPVDGGGNTGESGYQRFLKHEYMRSYVTATTDGILFDYADILNWSNDNELNTTTWTDYGGTLQTFPSIHSDNMLDLDGTYTEDGDHIGQRGALRLAKALWWMLARIAGWDGSPQVVDDIETSDVHVSSNNVVISISPNPVINSTAKIRFSADCADITELAIYDAQGRTLHEQTIDRVSGTRISAWSGCHEYIWNGFPASGVYFVALRYRLPDGGIAQSRAKIVVCE
jgi:hypothetical protein